MHWISCPRRLDRNSGFLCLCLVSASLVASLAGGLLFRMLSGHLSSVSAVSEESFGISFLIALLPFLLIFLSTFFSLRWLTILLVSLKLFAYTFSICWVYWLFPDAAWFYRLLILFTESLLLPLFVLMALTGFRQSGKGTGIWFFLCLALILIVCEANHFRIAPLLYALNII